MRIRTALAVVLGLASVATAHADLTREQARPIMYQAVADMVGGATSPQAIWGYPGTNDMFRLDVYTNNDSLSAYPLKVSEVGFDYMATAGPEPENRTGLKNQWDGTPWAEYFNLPSLPDSASVYHATRDSLMTVIEGTSVGEPEIEVGSWGRVKSLYR